MTPDLSALPDWPALMDEPTARAYCGGIGEEGFKGLMARAKVGPVDLGFGRKLWRRRDIDRVVDSLAMRGLTMAAAANAPDPAEAALARAAARRRA